MQQRMLVVLAVGAAVIGMGAVVVVGFVNRTPGAVGTETAAPTASPTAAPTQSEPEPQPGATLPGTRPPVVNHGPRVGNKVALTFDADLTDGMLRNLQTGRVTSYANVRIIDLLEREQVPATFFLTGKGVEQYPDLTQRIPTTPVSNWLTTPTGTWPSPTTATTYPGFGPIRWPRTWRRPSPLWTPCCPGCSRAPSSSCT